MKKIGYSDEIINLVDVDVENLEVELTEEAVKARQDYEKILVKYKEQTAEEIIEDLMSGIKERLGLQIEGINA